MGGDGDGAARASKSPPGRYDYMALERKDKKEIPPKEENRNLQVATITTLKVEFIDCVFKVRSIKKLFEKQRSALVLPN